ncbi:lengsin-like [Amphiura filiformis]|uniref:lengsin-like n=1 Tax=Amphiura filiformis TaxID=82378 RepID=UPI003B20D383
MDFSKEKLDKVLQKMTADDVQFVRWEQSDTYGVARSKTARKCNFSDKVNNGFPFYLGFVAVDPQCNIVHNSGYHEEIGYADGLMFADLDTYVTIPWCKNTGRVLMEPMYEGKWFAPQPRYVARKQLDRLQKMGYSLLSGYEQEFFVVDQNTLEPITKDVNVRSTIRNYKDPEFLHQIMTDLPKVGVDVDYFESEYAPGQFEVPYQPSFGISSADTGHTFRTSVKEIALQHGYIASFMSKPFPEYPGSSCHFNHSLWDIDGQKGLMYDADGPNGLSDVAQHWIAGILAHAPAISLLMAPTINCLKRFKPGTFAPCNVTWGIDNRSTAVRVKVRGERRTYVENRLGAAAGNPYISLAATVAAGIDGIQRELKLPPPVKGDAYDEKNLPPKTQTLPNDMKTALEYFANDDVIHEALGEEFCKCFGTLKLHEMNLEAEAKAKGDDDWERNLFFEYL